MPLPKLVPKKNLAGQVVGYKFWCEGCGYSHAFRTVRDVSESKAPIWEFNGDLDRPTFIGSLRVDGGPGRMCHLNLTDGQIHFWADSEHKYAGRIRPLADWPFDRFLDPNEEDEDDDEHA